MKILHCFADEGVESELLADYGEVYRIGLDVSDNNRSHAIQADAKTLPFKDSVTFDLGLFHPPCTKWSEMPSADTENAPNLIPQAREIAQQHCSDWIIENKPRAPLDDPVYLSGDMFGLPVDYKRAFETSFPVEQPPEQARFKESPGQPFFYTEYGKEWWATAKGYSPRYSAKHLSRNAVPRSYLNYLLRAWIQTTDTEERQDYSDYDKRMDKKRNQAANSSLKAFQEME
jgi:hypothetical protein